MSEHTEQYTHDRRIFSNAINHPSTVKWDVVGFMAVSMCRLLFGVYVTSATVPSPLLCASACKRPGSLDPLSRVQAVHITTITVLLYQASTQNYCVRTRISHRQHGAMRSLISSSTRTVSCPFHQSTVRVNTERVQDLRSLLAPCTSGEDDEKMRDVYTSHLAHPSSVHFK